MHAVFLYFSSFWGAFKMVQALVYPFANVNKGGFLDFLDFFVPYSTLCRSTVPEDAGIETRTVATSALAVRRSNKSVDLIH